MKSVSRFDKDVDRLIKKGRSLYLSLTKELRTKLFEQLKSASSGKSEEALYDNLPSFRYSYQAWYSEAKSLIKVVMPDRFDDFVSYYERPRSRKDVNAGNYVIYDYLQGLKSTFDHWGPECAYSSYEQQFLILTACKDRLSSSLFDIRSILQADLFDSEIDAADSLLKGGFVRPAGALIGVVLERHLSEIVRNRQISISRKHPTIADYTEALKAADAFDIPTWRFFQRMADLRNLCVHKKDREPSVDELHELISGARKAVATVF